MIGALWAFAFGILVTVFLTEVLRRLLPRLGWVDRPRPDRWHTTPVPRPGGPAIVAAVLLGIIALAPRPWSMQLWGLVIGSGFVFTIGLLDDIHNLPNPLKLTLLIVGAAVPLLFGVSFASLPAPFGIPLALIWILGVTNAVNWLDNMDGLAAGISGIAAVTFALLWASFADSTVSLIAALVAGASAGFLLFNFNPARIFMGDSGSGFLGFTLASLVMLGPTQHVTNVLVALIVPVMVLSIPIFDSAVVTVARILNGRRLFQGGRDHPSHRLVVLGLSERQAVLYLYTLSALAAAAGFVTARMGVWIGIVLAGVLVCGFFVVGVVVTRARVYQDAGGTPSNGRVILWQVMHKRRLLEVASDLVLICVAYLGAYLLRFEGTIPEPFMTVVGQSLPIVIIVKMAVLYAAGTYRGDWRYAGLLDLFGVARAASLGSLAVVALMFLLTRLSGYSRAVFVIDWLLTVGLLTSIRVSIRLLQEYIASQRILGKRVLIAGAGEGGVQLLQELRHNPALPYRAIGFVDDDPVKYKATIRGLPVLGNTREIPTLVRRYGIEEVLIAAPSMPRHEIERITLICSEAGVRCRPMRPLLEPAGE